MALDNRSILGTGIDEAVYINKSPVAEGFIAGLKAALLGAPLGAGIQAMRGKDAMTGAILGAAIPALIAGLTRGSAQKVENLETEAELRYHAGKIKEREPLFFMPPRQMLGRYFTRHGGG